MAANDPGIKSQISGIVVRPTGRMNKDLDPRYLRDGDFIDSLNTRAVTDTGGTTHNREAILGNTEEITLEPLVLQNKVILIKVQGGCELGAYSIEYDFFDANGRLLTTSVAPVLGTANATQVAAAVALSIQQAFLALPQFSVNVTFGAIPFDAVNIGVRVTFTGIAYWDYSIAVAASNTWPCPTSILTEKEPVDASLLGGWFQIGKYDLEGELFTWWTTQRHLPTDVPLALPPFLPFTNNGGEIQVTTNIPHNIPVGTTNFLIQIKGSLFTAANGLWMANAISAYDIVLQGSVFVAPPLDPGGVLVKWVKGIGEVHHSVKNWVTGAPTFNWVSTRLIRSTKFNFVTKKGIKAIGKKQSTRKRLVWTDDYNRQSGAFML